MRLAVLHNLPSGGALRSLATVLRALGPGSDVELFVPEGAERSMFDAETHVRRVHVYPWRTRWPEPEGRLWAPLRVAVGYARAAALWPVWRRIARDVDAGGFDAILVNPCRVFYTPPALRWCGTPSVFLCHEVFRWAHEPPVPRGHRPAWREWLNRALYGHQKALFGRLNRSHLRRAARVIANSRYSLARIGETYGVESVVEYPEVDAESFRPRDGPRRDVVLSVGGVEPTKGHDLTIRALGRIPPARRPPLEIIADREDPAERRFLEALAANRGVTVAFRLRVSEEELREAYATARLVAYAPVREPLGYAAIEAQASGTPVVGVAEGGLLETVCDGETGFLVPRDEAAFAAAVERVLGDADLARRLGEAGRRRVLERWARTGFGERIRAHLEAVRRLAASPARPDVRVLN